jgi:SAM-dependent methyltransferase
MMAIDLDPIERLYSESLHKSGVAPAGVGWKDEASHRLRFAKLLEIVRGHDRPFTVNDLGCGYGALLDFMREHELPVGAYAGYDISEPMLAAARARVGTAGATWIQGAALTRAADFSIASGIFNVRLDAADAPWEAYIEATIADLAAHSTRGFAFNLLTSHVDYREPHLYYGDPARYFDLCKRKYKRIALLHDYPLYEWTMLVRLS